MHNREVPSKRRAGERQNTVYPCIAVSLRHKQLLKQLVSCRSCWQQAVAHATICHPPRPLGLLRLRALRWQLGHLCHRILQAGGWVTQVECAVLLACNMS